jgi:molybdopterin-guanine dinucleotide biosynthesis protein A
VVAAVLAGGRSTRLGRDKARARLGGRTLLARAREAADALGWPVRVIRHDLVPRCGPLGGILTALKLCHAEAVVFLAVDMPFVSAQWLRTVARESAKGRCAVFAAVDGIAGFPFAIRREALSVVEAQITRGEYSLQALARALGAKLTEAEAGARAGELENINTPDDLAAARGRLRGSRPRKRRSIP